MTEGRVSLCLAAVRTAWTGVPVGGCCLTCGRTWENHLPCRCWNHPLTCLHPSVGLCEDSHTWASHLGTWEGRACAETPAVSPPPVLPLSHVGHLQPHGLQPVRLLCPWDSLGKNTGVGCHFLLQGIFLTQEWNLHLLHWQAGSLP